jgi:hypothetical protein
VVDVDVPASSRAPGGIVTAGFFTETWGLPDVKEAPERAPKP